MDTCWGQRLLPALAQGMPLQQDPWESAVMRTEQRWQGGKLALLRRQMQLAAGPGAKVTT